MKDFVCSIIGAVGGFISLVFGGWSSAMTTLLIFMGVDYLSGVILAGVFKKSPKTNSGALNSRIGWAGLSRKILTLLLVLVAHRIDLAVGTFFVKDAVCIAFITNELLSIVENAGLMGIPIPEGITKSIELLKAKGGVKE